MFRMEVEIKTEKYLPDLEIDRIDFIREPGGVKPRNFCHRKEGTDRGRNQNGAGELSRSQLY